VGGSAHNGNMRSMAKIVDYRLECMIPRERVRARLARPPRTRVRMPFEQVAVRRPSESCPIIRDGWMGAVSRWPCRVCPQRFSSCTLLHSASSGLESPKGLCNIKLSLTQHILHRLLENGFLSSPSRLTFLLFGSRGHHSDRFNSTACLIYL
jgi:hypothetical protein